MKAHNVCFRDKKIIWSASEIFGAIVISRQHFLTKMQDKD